CGRPLAVHDDERSDDARLSGRGHLENRTLAQFVIRRAVEAAIAGLNESMRRVARRAFEGVHDGDGALRTHPKDGAESRAVLHWLHGTEYRSVAGESFSRSIQASVGAYHEYVRRRCPLRRGERMHRDEVSAGRDSVDRAKSLGTASSGHPI